MILRKGISGFIGLLLLAGCNEESSKTDTYAYEPKETKETFFWKIEGNGLEHPSFLFGTIHMIPEEYYHLGESVEHAIKNSDMLLTEVKMEDLTSLAFSKDLNFDGNWIDSLSASDQKIILDALNEALGLNESMAKSMFGTKKPFLAYSSLMLKQLSSSSKSYEQEIIKIADDEDIENEGLEEASFQLGLFDQIPTDSIVTWMLTSISEEENAEEELQEIFKCYKNEELEKMVALMQETSPELMAYEDILVTERNLNWIPSIINHIKKKSCFIAVGAGHLPGDKGVIELLKKEGYTLTPLNVD